MPASLDRLSSLALSAWSSSVYPGPTPEETGYRAPSEEGGAGSPAGPDGSETTASERFAPSTGSLPAIDSNPPHGPPQPGGLFDLPGLLNRLWALPAATGAMKGKGGSQCSASVPPALAPADVASPSHTSTV